MRASSGELDGRLVVFSFPEGTPQLEKVKFTQRFWGQTTTSQGGKYEHHREGIMEEIGHRRLAPGVFLVGQEDLARALELLDAFEAEVLVRRVVLEEEDRQAFEQATD